nr:MAG TPA: hypothetical protein [Caudoviricetes sp.]
MASSALFSYRVYNLFYTLFVQIIQKYIQKIDQKKPRKPHFSALLQISIQSDFSTPQTRNGIPLSTKIHYNRKLKHAKYFYNYQPQNHSTYSHKV